MWDLPIPNSNEDLGEDFYTELEYLLHSSVKKQLVSDVPLGVFLSGGLDPHYYLLLLQKVLILIKYFLSNIDSLRIQRE